MSQTRSLISKILNVYYGTVFSWVKRGERKHEELVCGAGSPKIMAVPRC
ncbi:hypothetical protein [Sulfuracidifex tepidarius]|uniref:Uncharacterized protein n=1 Tax=Sulfuracidifex tepidarius TaxID=1294262 RepID=A0A510E0E0_9CREN|nr:hypothetical protein [Sulfuracidifex tepidarius]BBG25961.1 hypothetical protein IC007_0466 [Sulfuracidifex tepidarius]